MSPLRLVGDLAHIGHGAGADRHHKVGSLHGKGRGIECLFMGMERGVAIIQHMGTHIMLARQLALYDLAQAFAFTLDCRGVHEDENVGAARLPCGGKGLLRGCRNTQMRV